MDIYNQPAFVKTADLQLRSVIQNLKNKFVAGNDIGRGANNIETLFYAMGVTQINIDNRIYPATRQATTVLGALLRIVNLYGVRIECNKRVARIDQKTRAKDANRATGSEGAVRAQDAEMSFCLYFEDGEVAVADKVIVATGGGSKIPGVMEHLDYVPTRPVLGSLEVKEKKLCAMMDNTRVECQLRIERDGKTVFSEAGEVLFRKYGLSGIVTFNVSREALPGDIIRVDFFPGLDQSAFRDWLAGRLQTLMLSHCGGVTFRDFLYGLVPDAVVGAILRYAQVDGDARISKKNFDVANKDNHDSKMARVLEALKGWPFTYVGVADPDRAQVTRGGVAVGEVNDTSLECKRVHGLYMVGEALDVDGPCGGWNLHWAFTSGFLAGAHAACVGRALKDRGHGWTF
jgi:hypothetical protein